MHQTKQTLTLSLGISTTLRQLGPQLLLTTAMPHFSNAQRGRSTPNNMNNQNEALKVKGQDAEAEQNQSAVNGMSDILVDAASSQR